MMFNSRNLGALIVAEEPHVKSWEDGQYNILNMSIEETYGFGILQEGQAIAIAKNVKGRPNEFTMPARTVCIPGLALAGHNKALVHARTRAGTDDAAAGRSYRFGSSQWIFFFLQEEFAIQIDVGGNTISHAGAQQVCSLHVLWLIDVFERWKKRKINCTEL